MAKFAFPATWPGGCFFWIHRRSPVPATNTVFTPVMEFLIGANSRRLCRLESLSPPSSVRRSNLSPGRRPSGRGDTSQGATGRAPLVLMPRSTRRVAAVGAHLKNRIGAVFLSPVRMSPALVACLFEQPAQPGTLPGLAPIRDEWERARDGRLYCHNARSAPILTLPRMARVPADRATFSRGDATPQYVSCGRLSLSSRV